MADGSVLESRYSFSPQFLRGAAIFARKAHQIEKDTPSPAVEEIVAEHRAYVVAAIMQSVAALESDISELVFHGPSHHLGSNMNDLEARDLLRPHAGKIDKKSVLHRYESVLHRLKKDSLNKGGQTYKSTALLVDLRHALVHYKSKWEQEMEAQEQQLIDRLEGLGMEKPPFIPSEGVNHFPHLLLSASLASWAVTTVVGFIDVFYALLGFPSPLEPFKERLAVPSTRVRK